MNISVFHRSGSGGICRGIQVAEALGAKINPKDGYENDLCIYAKVLPPENFPKRSYLDVNDAPRALDFARSHPNIGLIAISEVQKEHLERVLGRKDVHLIPHHHCNYEQYTRVERPIEVVGIIGSRNSYQGSLEDLRVYLYQMGLTLKYEPDYWSTYGKAADPRMAVVDFFKTVDIQIAWRPEAWSPAYNLLRNPLKLSNAGSFGIPTIAYPEPSYMREWKGAFIPAKTIQELYDNIKLLKRNTAIYDVMSKRALKNAKKYHIDHIKNLYLKLP